jgi:hypothetical protein
MTRALEGSDGSASRPGRPLPPGKTRYPLYRRLGGPQGRCDQVRKISPPPGFDPRTVQPVASRYTDWATRPTYRIGLLKWESISFKMGQESLQYSVLFWICSHLKLHLHSFNVWPIHFSGNGSGRRWPLKWPPWHFDVLCVISSCEARPKGRSAAQNQGGTFDET